MVRKRENYSEPKITDADSVLGIGAEVVPISPVSPAKRGSRAWIEALLLSYTGSGSTRADAGLRQTSRRAINASGSNSTPEQQTHASGAEGDPFASLYGYAQHAGTLFFRQVDETNRRLVLGILWGLGPIDQVVHVRMNGQELPASILSEHYRGNSADSNYGTISPLILAAEPTYADTMIGLDDDTQLAIAAAYSVFAIPRGLGLGFPQFTAWIRGHPLHDPRDVGSDPDDESTWTYSANAGLVQADAYTHPLRGLNLPIDWSTVETAADDCDSGRLRETHLRIGTRQEGTDLIDVLGEYARCLIVADGATARQIPLKNEVPVASLDVNDTMDGFGVTSKPARARPDAIAVHYTHVDPTDVWKWQTRRVIAKRPGVTGNSQPYATQRLQMPGFTSRDMAYRYAADRLNTMRGDIDVVWTAPDQGLQLTVGDVVSITDDNGLSAFRMRITAAELTSYGSHQFAAVEDAPSMYSSQPAPDSPNVPPGTPSITSPAAPSTVTLTEEIYQDRDGRWKSRLLVTWTESSYAYDHSYAVDVLAANGDVLWSAEAVRADRRTFRTAQVQQGVEYSARVRAYTRLFSGDWAISDTYTAQGKLLVPGTPPSFQAWAVNGELFASWDEGADSDVERYRLTYAQITGGTPNPQPSSGLFLGLTDSLEFRTTRLTEGLWRIWCYAVDSVGQLSTTPATTDITITQAVNAYLVDELEITPDAPEANNIGQLYLDGQHSLVEYFVDNWSLVTDIFPASDISTYTDEIASYGHTDLVFPDPSFDNPGTYWHSVNGFVDTGGDGRRFKLTGWSSPTYTVCKSVTVVANRYYQFSIDVQESSGTPDARLVWRTAGPGAPVVLNGRTWEKTAANGHITYYGLVSSPTTTMEVGIDVQATDGSYIIVDNADLKEANLFFSNHLDLGSVITAAFRASITYTDYDDAAEVILETSDDDVTWEFQPSLSVRATARYVRVLIKTLGTDRFYTKNPIGTIYVDAVAERRTGTVTTLTTGGWDYQADGAHEASSASLFDFTGDLTIAARFRADVLGNGTARLLCGKLRDTGTGVLYLSAGSGDLCNVVYRFGSAPGVYHTARSPLNVTPGQTYVVVARRNTTDKTVDLWVDGVQVVEPSIYTITPLSETVTKFAVGGVNYVSNFDGIISDVAVWTAALTDAEIRNHSYNVSTRSTNLYAHYQFGGTGMSLTDSSGNGRTLSASTGLGSTDDHVTTGVPAWVLLDDDVFSAVKSINFTPLEEDPASFGVPKIQLLDDRFAFGVLGRENGVHVEQSALYLLEAV